jgi:hypothetical protein
MAKKSIFIASLNEKYLKAGEIMKNISEFKVGEYYEAQYCGRSVVARVVESEKSSLFSLFEPSIGELQIDYNNNKLIIGNKIIFKSIPVKASKLAAGDRTL